MELPAAKGLRMISYIASVENTIRPFRTLIQPCEVSHPQGGQSPGMDEFDLEAARQYRGPKIEWNDKPGPRTCFQTVAYREYFWALSKPLKLSPIFRVGIKEAA
jgi:hypothetical protein